MNILVTPPEMHFDKGFGISAWRFRDAAKVLIDSGNSKDLLSPIGYLQRHALELYLKSLIYILHKKYNIPFWGDFSLDNPAIFANGKWRPMSNTHNLDDLYSYFKSIYDSNFENLPKTTDWALSDTFGKQIKLTPTDHQISSISMLKKLYKSEADIINRLLYHLRPKNTVMKAVYSSE